MATAAAVDPLEKGLSALEHGHTYLAMSCLEEAMASGKTPLLCSHLAYCMAVNNKGLDSAIALAREALDAEPGNIHFRLNLGRILLLAGQKEEAIRVLRQGLYYGCSPELLAQLDQFGTRKAPLFPALPRGHFANKYSGLLLTRLGLR